MYTVFNIDQTTMSHVHKEEYAKQVEQFGANRPTDEKLLRMDVNKFIQSMKDNLVPIRKDATGIAHYDSKKTHYTSLLRRIFLRMQTMCKR